MSKYIHGVLLNSGGGGGGGERSYIQKYTFLLTSRFTGIVIIFPIDSYKNQQRYYKNH